MIAQDEIERAQRHAGDEADAHPEEHAGANPRPVLRELEPRGRAHERKPEHVRQAVDVEGLHESEHQAGAQRGTPIAPGRGAAQEPRHA